ncbi:hypothetical protein [Paenibacillus xylaniclasticus]|uniref:hypothetical protein n=1 Tax=Paenibacillus xylaniclasticus TaxID=588083 RepID=UPI000FDA50B8|nr:MULTISPECIES: hypothetical protein [Paenibacillus]
MSMRKGGMKFANVRFQSVSKRHASAGSRSCGCDHDHRSRQDDQVVDTIQDAGQELNCIFGLLEQRRVAEELVRAIRRHDRCVVEMILKHCGCDCKVVDFFRSGGFDCVRVSCRFGRMSEVKVTFDICIERNRSEWSSWW